MNRRLFMAVAACLAAAGVMTARTPAADVPAFDLTEWTPPQIGAVGDDPFAGLVKYGHALTVDTANQIGPAVADPAKRYAGNNLTCQNCHLDGGTRPYALPLTGVWGQFPQYRGREGQIGTLEERINGCMERSMNGHALPLDGIEMKAFLAYAKWLSSGIPAGARLKGGGTMKIEEPDRAADPARGAGIYADSCAVCHGADGRGRRAGTGAGYEFPPIAGPDSYNNGAGMTRILTAAAFVRHNMPLGTKFDAPVLSEADAYDVAAYINSLDRPAKPDLERDYPNKMQKPADAPYGPYVDGFTADQHKYGPFRPIRARLKELAAAQKRD
ncbi:MAG: c-type cytochrome [Bradyrhizobiaceae bacterium]|nr:c-type cytochrome [Bradyrhizobiaceae bacterium]